MAPDVWEDLPRSQQLLLTAVARDLIDRGIIAVPGH